MAITVTTIFVCAFYLERTPEWGTSFTLFGREPYNLRATASKKVDSLNGKEEKFESSFSRKDTRNELSAPLLIA
jgi:hypothetical protein